MKKRINISLVQLLLLGILVDCPLWAQPDAIKLLEAVDNNLNAAKDSRMNVKVVIVDKRGNESIRELTMMQKGSDKRMIKFLSPADQKGIGFLSLPGDNLTLYMPAYGKTRKIGGHVKNARFAGTDYNYEDMEAKRYTERYIPKLLNSTKAFYTLELIPVEGMRSSYARLLMTIRASDYYPTRIEYYDKANTLVKTQESSKIQKSGPYLLAHQTIMTDIKANTSTRMEVMQVSFDSGLADELFSERYLIR